MLSGEEDVRPAGEVDTFEALMTAIEPPTDFVVLDMSMLDGVSEEQLLQLRQRFATTPALFLAKEDRPESLDLAMRAGGRAYMLKSTPPVALVAAIRKIAAGQDVRELETTADLQALAESGRKVSRQEILTGREQEILRLLAEGRTVRETAGELALSVKTVEAHKLNLMRKLNIHNRASLIEYAMQNGYIPVAVPA